VFGAQAVAFHGSSRATADLDITLDLGERPLAPFVGVAAGACRVGDADRSRPRRARARAVV
jgi:hypothetical protein